MDANANECGLEFGVPRSNLKKLEYSKDVLHAAIESTFVFVCVRIKHSKLLETTTERGEKKNQRHTLQITQSIQLNDITLKSFSLFVKTDACWAAVPAIERAHVCVCVCLCFSKSPAVHYKFQMNERTTRIPNTQR